MQCTILGHSNFFTWSAWYRCYTRTFIPTIPCRWKRSCSWYAHNFSFLIIKHIVWNFLGIEAWLSVYDNGLQLQFARDPSVVLFYPIRSLIYCASIRFATRTQTGAEFPNGWRFVPLDSPAAARMENTRNPPLLAVTFRRTRHLPVDECHSFVTKTRQAALALVQACFSAYQATVPHQDCSKVPLYFKVWESKRL